MVEGVPNNCLGETEARVLTVLRRLSCSADCDLDTLGSGPGFLNPPETQGEQGLIVLALEVRDLSRLSQPPFGQQHPARINERGGFPIPFTGAVIDLKKPPSEQSLLAMIPAVKSASTAN
jgi:hypothetical protein